MAKDKQRLDLILVERGFFSARDKAKAAIMAAQILVDGKMIDKAGTPINPEAEITVKSPPLPYVSRGGLKLAKAIAGFGLDLEGKTVLDIGSSTGGFVDCALQHGAAKVYAVDVGQGQLAWKLRQDPRVVVREKTNARYLSAEQINDQIQLITIDVSFISLAKVLPQPLLLLENFGHLIALIKPQFEAGRDKVGKKGVIRDPAIHLEVLEKILSEIKNLGCTVKGLDHSPITGPKGNIEYLLWAVKGCTEPPSLPDPADIITAAWEDRGLRNEDR
ncbi:MAG: TlyA family RNA methyltransferase [Clostridiales bacterium]|nr:TlyA family RNA methyltransferase [Clostridiales bacterium]